MKLKRVLTNRDFAVCQADSDPSPFFRADCFLNKRAEISQDVVDIIPLHVYMICFYEFCNERKKQWLEVF